jgi:hypothetical protein
LAGQTLGVGHRKDIGVEGHVDVEQIDGQQRLTTLTLLLIRSAGSRPARSSTAQRASGTSSSAVVRARHDRVFDVTADPIGRGRIEDLVVTRVARVAWMRCDDDARGASEVRIGDGVDADVETGRGEEIVNDRRTSKAIHAAWFPTPPNSGRAGARLRHASVPTRRGRCRVRPRVRPRHELSRPLAATRRL